MPRRGLFLLLLAMALFTQTSAGVSVTVRVTPRAGKTAIAGVRDDVLLVKLAAAPVDGAANDALIALLADAFDVPGRRIDIAAGERGRTKRVCLVGASPKQLESRLLRLLPT
jgi:uncharacterized protein (TIGR00251 family)